MKFENKFKAGYTQSNGPAGTPHEGVYVDSRNIGELLISLSEKNIEIDKNASQIGYIGMIVPLGTIFPTEQRPTRYNLIGENLQIILQNYTEPHPIQRGPRRFGGHLTKITAVSCEITQKFLRENAMEDLEKFLETNRIVEEFYNSSKYGASEILKKLVSRG
jgi:hypothetical protein